MTGVRRRRTKGLAFASLLGLGACALLAPTEDVSRFYVLSPAADGDGDTSVACDVGDSRLGVGPVMLPAYLNRSQLARRVQENEISYSEVDRWAEDLEENIGRVIAANLSRLCDAGYVPVYPWNVALNPRYQVVVTVSRFESDTTGTATLHATWGIRLPADKTILLTQELRIREAGASPATADAVAAMSRAVATLSREIAGVLARVHGERTLSPRG
jgi:hypothetical protein